MRFPAYFRPFKIHCILFFIALSEINFIRFTKITMYNLKFLILAASCLWSLNLYSQSLQFHYDLRHTVDPKHNNANFPILYFEYFANQDSGSFFIKPGSFLIKMQSDFAGNDHNQGKFYMQVSQSFRCWKPKIFLYVEYSGGLGIAEPGSYGYYITNGFSMGLSHLFIWHEGYYNLALCYRFNAFEKPSHDAMISFYWWKGILKYKVELSGDLEVWTLNKNHGDQYTAGLRGKTLSIYGEPQVWINLNKKFACGTKINLNYHVLTNDNILQVYPTVGIKYKIYYK